MNKCRRKANNGTTSTWEEGKSAQAKIGGMQSAVWMNESIGSISTYEWLDLTRLKSRSGQHQKLPCPGRIQTRWYFAFVSTISKAIGDGSQIKALSISLSLSLSLSSTKETNPD